MVSQEKLKINNHVRFDLLEKSSEQIIFQETHGITRKDLNGIETLCSDYAQKHILKLAQLREDFIYRTLDTATLQQMKLRIETELLMREMQNARKENQNAG